MAPADKSGGGEALPDEFEALMRRIQDIKSLPSGDRDEGLRVNEVRGSVENFQGQSESREMLEKAFDDKLSEVIILK